MSSEKWSEQNEKTDPVSADIGLVIDSAAPSTNKKILLGSIPNSVEVYSDSRTYAVDDVVRILDTENFICTTAVTVAEPFDPAKWEPVRADLRTSAVLNTMTNFFTITSIQGNQTTDKVTVTLDTPDLFADGDIVNIIATTNYNVSGVLITLVNSTTFEYDEIDPNETEELFGITQDLSSFYVSATKGFIVDNSDTEKPLVDILDVPSQVVTVSGLGATTQVNSVFMDSSGTIFVLSHVDAVASSRKENLLLGYSLFSPDFSLGIVIKSAPDMTYDQVASMWMDNVSAGGKMYPGGVISEGTTDLTLDVAEGDLFWPAINYENNTNVTSFIALAAQTPIAVGSFGKQYTNDPTDPDATVLDFSTNTIDPNNYNEDATSLQPIPSDGPQFQIQRVYVADQFTIVTYGVTLYETLEEAQSNISNDEYVERAFTKPGAFRGYIIVKSGITSLDPLTEGTDWKLIAKVAEWSTDRGNPQNTTLGLTQDQINARDATRQTGSIDEGDVTNQAAITDISGDGATVTVIHSGDDFFETTDLVTITGTTSYDIEEVTITKVNSTTFTYSDTINTGSETGTAVNLNRVFLEEGQGEVGDHTNMPFVITDVSWSDEAVDLSSLLSNAIIYVRKNSSGVTVPVGRDSVAMTPLEDREFIKLAVVRTNFGNGGNDIIRGVTNLKVPLTAPLLTFKDSLESVFNTKSGLGVTEADPSVDYTMNMASGTVYAIGLNYKQSQNSPNVFSVGATNDFSFRLIDQDGEIDGVLSQDPDVDNYDLGGVITPVSPSTPFQVKRLWFNPENSQFFLQYGSATYTAANIAATAYSSETPLTPGLLSEYAYVIASLITSQGETNWDGDSNQSIESGDITSGTSTGGSSGGSAADTPWTVDHDAAGFSLTDAGTLQSDIVELINPLSGDNPLLSSNDNIFQKLDLTGYLEISEDLSLDGDIVFLSDTSGEDKTIEVSDSTFNFKNETISTFAPRIALNDNTSPFIDKLVGEFDFINQGVILASIEGYFADDTGFDSGRLEFMIREGDTGDLFTYLDLDGSTTLISLFKDTKIDATLIFGDINASPASTTSSIYYDTTGLLDGLNVDVPDNEYFNVNIDSNIEYSFSKTTFYVADNPITFLASGIDLYEIYGDATEDSLVTEISQTATTDGLTCDYFLNSDIDNDADSHTIRYRGLNDNVSPETVNLAQDIITYNSDSDGSEDASRTLSVITAGTETNYFELNPNGNTYINFLQKGTFNPTSDEAGLNIGTLSGNDPTTTTIAGDMYFLNDFSAVRMYDGTDWSSLITSLDSIAELVDVNFTGTPTEGDIMIHDLTDWDRLPIGSVGQVLIVNSGGTAPEWTTIDIITTPTTTTINAIPRWGDATGDELLNSGILIDGSDNITGVTSITTNGTDVATTGTINLGVDEGFAWTDVLGTSDFTFNFQSTPSTLEYAAPAIAQNYEMKFLIANHSTGLGTNDDFARLAMAGTDNNNDLSYAFEIRNIVTDLTPATRTITTSFWISDSESVAFKYFELSGDTLQVDIFRDLNMNSKDIISVNDISLENIINFPDGIRQTFNPDSALSGLNVGITNNAGADLSGTAVNGDIYYDDNLNKFRAFENSTWVDVIGGGGASALNDLTDVTISSQAKGNILAAESNSSWINLTVGGDGQVLSADSNELTGLKWVDTTGTGTITKSGTTADNEITRWDGNSSTVIQGSAITLDDTPSLTQTNSTGSMVHDFVVDTIVADDTPIGILRFTGKDDGDAVTVFGEIEVQMQDDGTSSKDTAMIFRGWSNNEYTDFLTYDGNDISLTFDLSTSAGVYSFNLNATQKYIFGNSGMDITGGFIDNIGLAVFDAVTTPGTPVDDKGYLFVNDDDGPSHLFYRNPSGDDFSTFPLNLSSYTSIEFIIDGGGAAITTGIKGDLEIPFKCEIVQARVFADQDATAQIDIWSQNYINYPATDTESITGANPLTLPGTDDKNASTLVGWTTEIPAENILRYNVDANDVAQRITVSLTVVKT